MFAAINGDETLEVTVKKLIKSEIFDKKQTEDFYQFIVSLHKLGFLNLPISDEKSLYARFERKKSAAAKAKWMSLMYFKIPLMNPDAFLNRYIHLAKHLFSKTACTIWLILMAISAYLVYANFSALTQPLNGLLATQNIAFMWIALIGLKIVHEFGHAFACKHFGGHVPRNGCQSDHDDTLRLYGCNRLMEIHLKKKTNRRVPSRYVCRIRHRCNITIHMATHTQWYGPRMRLPNNVFSITHDRRL